MESLSFSMSPAVEQHHTILFPAEHNDTNCSSSECYDAELMDEIRAYIYPTTVEWVLIAAHLIVFIVGLIGNALVCMAVYRNSSMRTVTNYFIFNLAFADFMVILFCLPPTVIWDVTETWFLGNALCKIILYLQTVSVAVSVLTLTGISVERWYAICYPLKFKATTKRAKRVIIIIWIISLLFGSPELIVLETVERHDLNMTTIFFTQCTPTWSYEYEIAFIAARVLSLYIIPLSFMSIAYYKIVRVLWSSTNIPREGTLNSDSCSQANGNYAHYNAQLLNPIRGQSSIACGTGVDHHLNQRRKAAKMLVAVVSVFALSYLPVHIFNIATLIDLKQSDLLAAIAMTVHWLPYANSAINPVIYNFMSGKFRREFARAFQECLCCTFTYIPANSRVYSYNHQQNNSQRLRNIQQRFRKEFLRSFGCRILNRTSTRRYPIRVRRLKPRLYYSSAGQVVRQYSTYSGTLPNTSTLNL